MEIPRADNPVAACNDGMVDASFARMTSKYFLHFIQNISCVSSHDLFDVP